MKLFRRPPKLKPGSFWDDQVERRLANMWLQNFFR